MSRSSLFSFPNVSLKDSLHLATPAVPARATCNNVPGSQQIQWSQPDLKKRSRPQIDTPGALVRAGVQDQQGCRDKNLEILVKSTTGRNDKRHNWLASPGVGIGGA